MTLSNRDLSKIALVIQDQLETLRVSRYDEVQKRLERLLTRLEQLSTIKRKLNLCMSWNYLGAANKVADQVSFPILGCTLNPSG